MKNLKQAFAVLIALSMILGTVAFANFSDVASGSAYAEAIEVGVALGLYAGYEDGTFKPEGDITRAEFAAIVVRAKGQAAQVGGSAGSTRFVDVPSDHWAAGYINLATNQGIIAGYGDGNFGPEDNVTYEQAVKMLVEAIGYGPAVGSAGYPVGYLTIANQRGMTTGVNGQNGVAINRGQVSQLVFNTLDVPLMEQSGFGNYIQYLVQDGTGNDSPFKKSLLSESFGVAKLRVNVLKNLGVDGVRRVGMAQIQVDRDYRSKFGSEDYYGDADFAVGRTVNVAAGESDILSLVGANVIAYIQVDESGDSDHTVLYASRFVSSTDSVELIIDEIENIIPRGSGDSAYYEVEYYETTNSARTTKITVADDARVYVNGHKEDSVTVEDIRSFYGTVSFSSEVADTTSSADYDTVFVNDYKIMIVDEVNTSAGRVTGEGQVYRIVFDPNDTAYSSRLIDVDGNELEWTSLKESDVLAVQEVRGSGVILITATLIEETVTGSVNLIDEDSDARKTEYGIGGNSYKININVFSDSLELGDEGIFYLDIMGRIVNFELEDVAARNYAYVIAFDPDIGGLDNVAQVRFYTAQGEIVTFDTASKVTFVDEDGTMHSGTDSSDIGDYINEGDVVTFTLNSAGRINRITQPRSDAAGTTGFRKYTEGTAGEYNYRTERFSITGGRSVYVDSSTVIMNVGEIEDGNYSDDDFELVSLAAASDDIDIPALASGANRILAFDVNKSNVARAVVIVGPFDITSDETGIAMLLRSSVTSVANGERRAVATVFQDAIKNDFETINLVASSDLGENLDLKEADLFTANLNAAGQIRAGGITKVATIQGSKAVRLVASSGSKVEYKMYDVISRTGARIEVEDESGKEDVIAIPSRANVYIYNSSGNNSARKVLATPDRYNVFYSAIERSTVGNSTVEETVLYDEDNNELDNVQMFVRYYDGEVADVVFYLWK